MERNNPWMLFRLDRFYFSFKFSGRVYSYNLIYRKIIATQIFIACDWGEVDYMLRKEISPEFGRWSVDIII